MTYTVRVSRAVRAYLAETDWWIGTEGSADAEGDAMREAILTAPRNGRREAILELDVRGVDFLHAEAFYAAQTHEDPALTRAGTALMRQIQALGFRPVKGGLGAHIEPLVVRVTEADRVAARELCRTCGLSFADHDGRELHRFEAI